MALFVEFRARAPLRILSVSLRVAVCAGLLFFWRAPEIRAQSIKDTVKGHVDDELEGEGKEKRQQRRQRQREENKARAKRPPPSRPQNIAPGQGKTISFSVGGGDAKDLIRPEDKNHGLPKRLFSKWFSLDLEVDGAYRGWLPQQYALVDVDVAGYYTWSVALKGKFFKYISLHRGYYESNALAPPRTREATVAQRIGDYVPKAAWLLGMLGFPVLKRWEPIVRYEARSFNTTATPKAPVCIVNKYTNTSMDLSGCPRTMNPLQVISGFETLVFGVRYHGDRDPSPLIKSKSEKIPPVYAGLGLMSYSKPYQVTVGGATLPDVLFDARFQGAGLAMGTELGGGVNRLYMVADVQLGVGRVQLANDLTLNELAPKDWLIGDVQGNVQAGYRFAIFDGPPTIFLTPELTAGGASFHFINTKAEPGQGTDAPSLNWDFLWSARLNLEFAL